MAIIVLIAAFAIPVLQRTFESQKIVSAADRVRAECGKARASAMRTGEVYAFYYAQNADFFAVAPFKDAEKFVQTTNSVASDERFTDFDFEQDLLPRGISFVGANVVDDTRTQMERQTAEGASVTGMTPILFYPNGESQSAEIYLRSEETGEVMKVKVRGLTGTTSVAEVQ